LATINPLSEDDFGNVDAQANTQIDHSPQCNLILLHWLEIFKR
jgi:hypothetical protein